MKRLLITKKLCTIIISVVLICSLSFTALAATNYVVQPGDVLWKIAVKYNTTYQEIANANGIKDPNLITEGQKLIIPAAPQGIPQQGPQPGGPPPGGPPAPKLEEVDGFRVITVGTSGPPMSPDSTWSSTLVQYKDKVFLVDCGGGTTHGLMKAGVHPALITNMFFTHHHADHDSDYFTFAIGGWNGPMGRRSLNLVGPEGTQSLHEMMMKYYKSDLEYRMRYSFPPEGLAKNVFIKEIAGSDTFEMDGVKVSTAEMTHTMYNLAYRFDAGGKSVVVSGDTGFDTDLITLAKDADILVMDAHVPLQKIPPLPPAPPAKELPVPEGFTRFEVDMTSNTGGGESLTIAHATLDDIAKMANEAGVKKLILTHLPPTGLKQDIVAKFFEDNGFKGEVVVAETLGKY